MTTLISQKTSCWFVESVCMLAIMFFSTGSMKAQVTPTPTPVANGKIAFLSTRDGTAEIYLMNADGSKPTRITHSVGPPTVHMPAVSPDGTKIVFARNFGYRDEYEICVMDADGSNEIRLTRNPGNDYHPDWSPDGRRIAFCSQRDGNYEIYIMNADGSNPLNLTNNSKDDSNPAWSCDGSKIAFDSNRSGYHEIYVMSANGSNPTRLTTMAYNVDPAWSPDGARIAFTSWRWSTQTEITVMNADGSDQKRLTYTLEDDGASFPSWSTDGTKIAFYAGSEIYSINADGSDRINLTNQGGNVLPNWQKPQADVLPAPSVGPNPEGSR